MRVEIIGNSHKRKKHAKETCTQVKHQNVVQYWQKKIKRKNDRLNKKIENGKITEKQKHGNRQIHNQYEHLQIRCNPVIPVPVPVVGKITRRRQRDVIHCKCKKRAFIQLQTAGQVVILCIKDLKTSAVCANCIT